MDDLSITLVSVLDLDGVRILRSDLRLGCREGLPNHTNTLILNT